MGMLIVAQGMKFLKGRNVMYQKSELPTCTSVLAMVKLCAKMRHLGKEGLNAFDVPKEASTRIFDREEDSMFVAKPVEALSHIVELVGSSDSGLQIWAKVG